MATAKAAGKMQTVLPAVDNANAPVTFDLHLVH